MSFARTAIPAQPLPLDMRCAYPSKVCAKPRAVKQNKTLHRLCEFHRRKANLNQQRMQQRRRMLQRESAGRDSASPVAPEILLGFEDPIDCQDHKFSPEELEVLEIMLFDSEDDCDSDSVPWTNSPPISC